MNAAEVLDQLVRVFGRDPDDVHADLALLSHAGMEIAPVSVEIGLLAGHLRARHYHRDRSSVPHTRSMRRIPARGPIGRAGRC